MEQVLRFSKKLITLAIVAILYGVSLQYSFIPFFISIPILLLAFSIICSRITRETPKELYNYQRSEKFFARGGLRDLARIPVVLLAFLHDVAVWLIWGIYQLFIMFTDTLWAFKKLVYYIFYAILWVLKLLLPFWRIVLNFIFFYCVKWPWWIYRYAFKALPKTFNTNILRLSFGGTFLALLVFQLFYFLELTLEIKGLRIMGAILSVLPISWIFAEIASLRAQKKLKAPYAEIRLQFRNGLETVRGILFFLMFFVVMLLAQAGLNWLGWIPKSGILFLGATININFLINIVLLFLLVLIVLGAVVLPSFRLYNDFRETSAANVLQLLRFIGKRFFQVIGGFVPSAFFAMLSAVPVTLVVIAALFATIRIKDNIIQVKIDKHARQIAVEPGSEYKLIKGIAELKYYKQFPSSIISEIEHRPFLLAELNNSRVKLREKKNELAAAKEYASRKTEFFEKAISDEKLKSIAVNQTRIEDLSDSVSLLKSQFAGTEKKLTSDIDRLNIDIEFAARKYNQLPVVFFLGTFFMVVCLTFVFVFVFGYFGNFFYNSFIFRNDNQPAQWKIFIEKEKTIDHKQPLLSATLNIVLILALTLILFYQDISLLL
ncbi:MAG: hypothetical protein JXB34_04120 [Bacteroidales bacterium]|nr:hypothetical protein [Bacteroidales bacterium]